MGKLATFRTIHKIEFGFLFVELLITAAKVVIGFKLELNIDTCYLNKYINGFFNAIRT